MSEWTVENANGETVVSFAPGNEYTLPGTDRVVCDGWESATTSARDLSRAESRTLVVRNPEGQVVEQYTNGEAG